MAVINSEDLIKKIKNNEYSNVYYFYGKDIFNIEKILKKLVSTILKNSDETYCLHKFNSDNLDMSELSNCVNMIPFMSEYICVTLNDINAENLYSDDIETLTEIISNIPESTIIIFYVTGFDVCGGKRFPTAKNKKIIDVVSKYGTVCDFSLKTPADLSKGIMDKAKKNGCSISKDTSMYLASKLLSDPMAIENEMDKLVSYSAEREITKEDIDLLSAPKFDSTAFDLAKAVVNFNSDKAYNLLNELFLQSAESIPILAAITMSFTDIYRAKTAKLANKNSADVKEDFKYPKNRAFAVDNAFRDVRKIEINHIRKCMAVLADTDIKLKSTANDGRLLIEKAIATMLLSK